MCVNRGVGKYTNTAKPVFVYKTEDIKQKYSVQYGLIPATFWACCTSTDWLCRNKYRYVVDTMFCAMYITLVMYIKLKSIYQWFLHPGLFGTHISVSDYRIKINVCNLYLMLLFPKLASL
jgi:hypothetical protein